VRAERSTARTSVAEWLQYGLAFLALLGAGSPVFVSSLCGVQRLADGCRFVPRPLRANRWPAPLPTSTVERDSSECAHDYIEFLAARC
jgi:hypothetical protein